jgi:hypothetical protein
MAADSLPKYMHPHSVARIIDNAVLTVSSSGLSNIFVAMEAEKGMPNEATYITTQSEWIFNFGEPNYAKYGQAQLNAINAINSGYGAWVIRVVPDDETFASLSLGIGYRPDQAYTNDEDEYKRLELTKTQIQLWNAAASNPAEKVAIFKASGNSYTSRLGYICETESASRQATYRTDIGLVTEDYAQLYALQNSNANIIYEFVQKKYKNTYENPYVKFSMNSNVANESSWTQIAGDYWSYGTMGDNPSSADVKYTILAKSYKDSEEAETRKIPDQIEVTVYANAVTDSFAKAVADAVDKFAAYRDGKTASALETDLIKSLDGFGEHFVGDLDNAIGKEGVDHTNEWLTGYRGRNAALVFSTVKLDTYCSNVTSGFKFYIGAAKQSENGHTGWNPAYEVYKLVNGFYVPVIADDLNGEYALTSREYQEFCEIFEKDENEYILADSDIDQNGTISGEALGQYKTEMLYYVNYLSNGEPVYDTHTTNADSFNYNTLRSATSGKIASYNGDSDESVTPIVSMKSIFVPVTKTSMTYAKKVPSSSYWQVGAADINKVISTINDFSAIAEAVKNFMEVTAEEDTDGDGVLSIEIVKDDSSDYDLTVEEAAKLDKTLLDKWFEAVIDSGSGDSSNASNEAGEILGYVLKDEALVKIENVPVTKTMKAVKDKKLVSTATGEELEIAVSAPSVKLAATIGETVVDGTVTMTVYADKAVNDSLKVFDEAETDKKTAFKIVAVQGEKATYKCGSVDFGNSKLTPNINYIERIYDAIGLAATTYTTYKMHEKTYAPYKQSETDATVRIKDNTDGVWTEIEEYKEGYRVGSDFSVIPNIDLQATKSEGNCFAEFIRFTPKGSGKWYNRISVSLAYNNNYDGTYPDWSMFTLTVAERVDGVDTAREQFTVSLDPDAISGSKESLYIEDVVRRYSSYVNCTVNYDNLRNFIETKLAVLDDKKKPIYDEDGNEIIVPVDTVIKYIFGIIDLDEFKERVFGEDYEHDEELLKASTKFDALMSVLGADEDGCKFDTGRYTTAEGGLQIQEYTEPFNSFMLFNTVSSSAALYLDGGSSGNGWEYEYDDEEGNKAFTSSLAQALVRAYSGVTDPFITNTNLCEFDLMFDANYDETVRKAMVELASVTRQDCMALLDQGLSIANATQAIDYRKNTENYDTFYAAIFTQHLTVNDGWSGKPIKVTPTYFLSSKIPANDIANGKTCNFVGPRRGTVSGFTNISFMPTPYEMSELYKAQVNYIERDALGVYFATELTSQTKNTPLTLIHAVRGLLSLKRDFLKISRNYRSEYASTAVQAQLLGELNTCAAEYILQGAFKYITPVISSTEYDIQQRICRIDVSVAFVDIMERFVFSFIVER